MLGLMALMISLSGLADSSDRQKAISSQDGREDGAPANRAEVGGVDLDADAGAEVDGLGGAAVDHPGQHRGAVDEAGDVAQHDLRLVAVGGEDHHDRPAARVRGDVAPAEAGDVDGDEGGDEGLAAPPAGDDPHLAGGHRGGRGPPGVAAEDGGLLLGHGEPEQRLEERSPRSPRLGRAEPPAEEVGVGHGLDDGDGGLLPHAHEAPCGAEGSRAERRRSPGGLRPLGPPVHCSCALVAPSGPSSP